MLIEEIITIMLFLFYMLLPVHYWRYFMFLCLATYNDFNALQPLLKILKSSRSICINATYIFVNIFLLSTYTGLLFEIPFEMLLARLVLINGFIVNYIISEIRYFVHANFTFCPCKFYILSVQFLTK